MKPLKFEELIIEKVNSVYENFKDNIGDVLEVPADLKSYYESKKEIKSIDDLKEYGTILDANFGNFKPIEGQSDDAMILVNHQIAAIQDAMISIISMNNNLKSNGLAEHEITDSNGIDVLAATAMQMLAVKGNELDAKFRELKLDEDTTGVLAAAAKQIDDILNQNSQEAFSRLLENIMEFIAEYNIVYEKLTKVPDDRFAMKRIEWFMDYMDAYYLLSYMLLLVLTYPKDQGQMTEKQFEGMVPTLKTFA